MENTWSLSALLGTSFCFQLKWCIYFMLGILKLLRTLTSFISASSLMHFTHSKIIRDIYEVNTMHNRLSYLVIFLFLVSFIYLRMWSLEMGRLPGQGRPGNTPSSNGTRYYLIRLLMWFVMQHSQELIFLVDRNSHSFTPVRILSKFIYAATLLRTSPIEGCLVVPPRVWGLFFQQGFVLPTHSFAVRSSLSEPGWPENPTCLLHVILRSSKYSPRDQCWTTWFFNEHTQCGLLLFNIKEKHNPRSKPFAV